MRGGVRRVVGVVLVLLALSAGLAAHFVFNRPRQQAGNTTQQSVNKAKRVLRQIYADRQVTFYCGCSYAGRHVDHASCGYVPKSLGKRAHRVEWEHVVPAEALGGSFEQWWKGDPRCIDRRGRQFKGRNCTRKVSVAFRYMEADMYNLYPVIGEINSRRSSFSMALIPGEAREFGHCDIEITGQNVEPRPEIRGDIARTYMYMDAAYPDRGITLRKDRTLFAEWDEEDPVDAWECERARSIEEIQRNRNEFVAAACEEAGL